MRMTARTLMHVQSAILTRRPTTGATRPLTSRARDAPTRRAQWPPVFEAAMLHCSLAHSAQRQATWAVCTCGEAQKASVSRAQMAGETAVSSLSGCRRRREIFLLSVAQKRTAPRRVPMCAAIALPQTSPCKSSSFCGRWVACPRTTTARRQHAFSAPTI